jgi:hypothetical protein
MITKETTKYWKKAIKNDRVMITNDGESVYILNGFNAFKFPAMPLLWDEIARPAFMVDMPEEGNAFMYFCGKKQPAIHSDIIKLFENVTKDKTPATRSAFTYEGKDVSLRLYKNANGSVTGINIKYDAMINPEQVKNIYCGGRYSPVILENEHFTALIMPVRMHDAFPNHARDTFAKLLEV